MTTAERGGGLVVECLGVKRQNSPLVICHDKLLFTILLGALKVSRRLELNAEEKTGLPTYMYSDISVHSRTAQYRQSRALSVAWSSMSP